MACVYFKKLYNKENRQFIEKFSGMDTMAFDASLFHAFFIWRRADHGY